MTEVIQPEQSNLWDPATGAIQGGKIDASTLTARGAAMGYRNPGFIARGNTMLMPSSADDWT